MAQQPTTFQKQIIQEPQDIGNYFPTGLCMGPPTTGGSVIPGFSGPTDLTAQSALAYGYGNGLLIGPECTYRIFPVIGFQDISSANPFTVALKNTKATFVANTASPRSSQLLDKKSGKKAIQFDVPRTVAAVFDANTGGALTVPSTMTALCRGIDIWGQKVTTQIDFTTTNGLTANSYSALFQVHEIEITDVVVGTVGAAPTITFKTGDEFGLPYKFTDMGHVKHYSQWWQQILNAPPSQTGANGLNAPLENWSEVTNNPAIPFYWLDATPAAFVPFQLAFPERIRTGFNPQNANSYPGDVPKAIAANTPDVRGLISPQNHLAYAYSAGSPPTYNIVQSIGSYNYQGPFSISYYVPGADVFPWKYAQMLNTFQQAALLDGSVAQGGWEGFGNSFYANTNGNKTNDCEPNLKLLIGETPYSDF